MTEDFETMLTGGHPNSLGRTIEVVDLILADETRLDELYQCYFSKDEIVRLRVSNGFRRVTTEHPDWAMNYMEGLLTDIAAIDQASTQWTLAMLFDLTRHLMSEDQKQRALDIMKNNLACHEDWIVLNNSMKILGKWAKTDPALKAWMHPHLQRLAKDPRKSVSGNALKLLK